MAAKKARAVKAPSPVVKVSVSLKASSGAFTRLQAWINEALIINTDGGDGSGSMTLNGDAVVAVRARGVAGSEFACVVKRGSTKKHDESHELPASGVFNDETHVRC